MWAKCIGPLAIEGMREREEFQSSLLPSKYCFLRKIKILQSEEKKAAQTKGEKAVTTTLSKARFIAFRGNLGLPKTVCAIPTKKPPDPRQNWREVKSCQNNYSAKE